MMEVWVRPNRRAILCSGIVPATLLLGGCICLWLSRTWEPPLLWLLAAGVLYILSGVVAWAVFVAWRTPRVAMDDDQLLLYLNGSIPESVPVDVVECFFRGQAEGLMPTANGRDAEVNTVIVRLAEAASEYHHRDVQPALGLWCEGYITIRGTWCEPISPELLRKLNQRLVEVQRSRKQRFVECKT